MENNKEVIGYEHHYYEDTAGKRSRICVVDMANWESYHTCLKGSNVGDGRKVTLTHLASKELTYKD